MAYQPDRDPWGKEYLQKGPPDLDDLTRNLKKTFASYLGGERKKPSGNNSVTKETVLSENVAVERIGRHWKLLSLQSTESLKAPKKPSITTIAVIVIVGLLLTSFVLEEELSCAFGAAYYGAIRYLPACFGFY